MMLPSSAHREVIDCVGRGEKCVAMCCMLCEYTCVPHLQYLVARRAEAGAALDAARVARVGIFGRTVNAKSLFAARKLHLDTSNCSDRGNCTLSVVVVGAWKIDCTTRVLHVYARISYLAAVHPGRSFPKSSARAVLTWPCSKALHIAAATCGILGPCCCLCCPSGIVSTPWGVDDWHISCEVAMDDYDAISNAGQFLVTSNSRADTFPTMP